MTYPGQGDQCAAVPGLVKEFRRGGDGQRPGSTVDAVGRGFDGIVEVVSANHDDVYSHAQIA